MLSPSLDQESRFEAGLQTPRKLSDDWGLYSKKAPEVDEQNHLTPSLRANCSVAIPTEQCTPEVNWDAIARHLEDGSQEQNTPMPFSCGGPQPSAATWRVDHVRYPSGPCPTLSSLDNGKLLSRISLPSTAASTPGMLSPEVAFGAIVPGQGKVWEDLMANTQDSWQSWLSEPPPCPTPTRISELLASVTKGNSFVPQVSNPTTPRQTGKKPEVYPEWGPEPCALRSMPVPMTPAPSHQHDAMIQFLEQRQQEAQNPQSLTVPRVPRRTSRPAALTTSFSTPVSGKDFIRQAGPAALATTAEALEVHIEDDFSKATRAEKVAEVLPQIRVISPKKMGGGTFSLEEAPLSPRTPRMAKTPFGGTPQPGTPPPRVLRSTGCPGTPPPRVLRSTGCPGTPPPRLLRSAGCPGTPPSRLLRSAGSPSRLLRSAGCPGTPPARNRSSGTPPPTPFATPFARTTPFATPFATPRPFGTPFATPCSAKSFHIRTCWPTSPPAAWGACMEDDEDMHDPTGLFKSWQDQENRDPNVGRFKREFSKVDTIKEGRFSTVFRAQHKMDKQVYAIKAQAVASDIEQQALMREVAALSSIWTDGPGCANLLRYFGAWLEDGLLHVQTEPFECSLRDRLCQRANAFGVQHEPRTAEEIATLLHEASAGLAVLHSKGIAHTDVRPENILVSKEGRFLVAGLGRCRRLSADESTLPDISSADCAYLAPEAVSCKGELSDLLPGDVFSLALVACEFAISPEALERDGSVWDQLRRGQLCDSLLSLGQLCEETLGQPLLTLLRRMLCITPSERPSCAEISEQAAALVPEPDMMEVEDDLVEVSRRRRRAATLPQGNRDLAELREALRLANEAAEASRQRAEENRQELEALQRRAQMAALCGSLPLRQMSAIAPSTQCSKPNAAKRASSCDRAASH